MVGTPESAVFFEQAMQLARRSLGLRYDVMEYGEDFKTFCEVLYSYQYVRQRTEITNGITEWLYEHTSGNISVVVSLIHDAQEIAILNGREVLIQWDEAGILRIHRMFQYQLVQGIHLCNTLHGPRIEIPDKLLAGII